MQAAAEAMDATEQLGARPSRLPWRIESVGAALRRFPFTLTVVGIMLLLGVVTQSLWNPLQDRALFPYVAYGLPSLEAGRLWTPVTGSFFALVPAQYIPVAGGALVLFGWSEWRLGTRRVAIAAIAAQLFGVLGTSLFLVVFRGTGWAWAQQLSETLDVGFSAGALGAVAAASATLIPPWRGRVRFVLCLYVSISLLYIGLLWDVEHFLAVMLGLVLGPFLLGRKPRFNPARFTRHEWRVIAATFFIVSAVDQHRRLPRPLRRPARSDAATTPTQPRC